MSTRGLAAPRPAGRRDAGGHTPSGSPGEVITTPTALTATKQAWAAGPQRRWRPCPACRRAGRRKHGRDLSSLVRGRGAAEYWTWQRRRSVVPCLRRGHPTVDVVTLCSALPGQCLEAVRMLMSLVVEVDAQVGYQGGRR